MKFLEAIPSNDHRTLRVVATTGECGLFDVSPYLDSEAFAPLKQRGEFEKVHNGGYFVEWESGADLSADTITANWMPIATKQSAAN